MVTPTYTYETTPTPTKTPEISLTVESVKTDIKAAFYKTPFLKRTPRPTPLFEKKKEFGFIAIIIDDCGVSIDIINKFLEISHEFTFSILPNLSNSFEIARYLHEKGCEIMLHLPMEPEDLINNDPGKNSLLINLSDEEIKRRTEIAINSVPYISGVNNHMGSEFTQYQDKLEPALEVISKYNLFFVDSVTTGASKAYALSISMGLRSYKRDFFLDSYESQQEVKINLYKLIDQAKKSNFAIAICHAKPQTVMYLHNLNTILKENNVTLVRISGLP
jgi:uncharacterized protein